MFLDSNRKLSLVLTTAATTLNMPVDIDYVDITTTTTSPAPFNTYTSGTTPIDILPAPAASTTRKVNSLTIYNRDTAAKTIRVYKVDATPTTGLITAGAFVTGNDYQIVSVGTTNFTLIGASANTVGVIFTATGAGTGTGIAATCYQQIDLQINVDDSLCYTDVQGWYAVDSQGNLKSVQSASASSIATAIHGTTDKTTPIGADEFGIWDSVTGLLNKVSFTNALNWFAAKLGNAANVFSVAPATAAAQAVRLDQIPYPYRNRLINSDQSVNQIYNPTQAANGTAVTPTAAQFVTDQWQTYISQASKLTFQQVSDAPAGLKYSLKVSVAAQFSPAATDQFLLFQNIEGQNIIDFQFGQAGAVTIICSNWIKGSIAGTYAVAIRNGAGNRAYVGTVSVTTSWQRLSISLIGDTSGTWATDISSGLQVRFDLGSGSNFNTTAGSWQAGDFSRTSGAITFVNQVNGSTLNITGSQVEKGVTGQTVPTDFEVLSYDTQLRRAQWYYEQALATDVGGLGNTQTLPAYIVAAMPGFRFKFTKRTPPTVVIYSRNGTAAKVSSSVSGSDVGTSVTANTISNIGVNAILDSGSGFTVGTVGYEAFYTADARL